MASCHPRTGTNTLQRGLEPSNKLLTPPDAHSAEPHPVPTCPLPRPSSLRLKSKMGNAQSAGAGVQGGGPASKPQRGENDTLFVLPRALNHTFHHPLLPTRCHWVYQVEISRGGAS